MNNCESRNIQMHLLFSLSPSTELISKFPHGQKLTHFSKRVIYFCSLGFSRWGLWIHARSCMRPSVLHTPYLENRTSDFDDFLPQSYILMSLKKCSKRIFEKSCRFQVFGQKWLILPFLAKKSCFWTFSSNPHIRFV